MDYESTWLRFADALRLLELNNVYIQNISLEHIAISEPDFRDLCGALSVNEVCCVLRIGRVDWHPEIQARTAVWMPQRLAQNTQLLSVFQVDSTSLIEGLRIFVDSNRGLQFAGQSSMPHVSLSNRQLRQLPPSLLANCAHVSTLDLSHNNLTAVPDVLLTMQCLIALDLSNNSLKSLPPNIGQLARLQALDLSDNRIASLPESLGTLSELIVCDLHNNSLTTLLDPALQQLVAHHHRRINICLFGNKFTELSLVPRELQGASGADLVTYVRRCHKEFRCNYSTRLLFVSMTHGLLSSTQQTLSEIFADPKNACRREIHESFQLLQPTSQYCRVKRRQWTVTFQQNQLQQQQQQQQQQAASAFGSSSSGGAAPPVKFPQLNYELWDLANEDISKAVCPFYLCSRSISIVLFSLSSRSDTGAVNQFIQNLRSFGGSKVILLGIEEPTLKKKMKAAQKNEVIAFYRCQFPVAIVPVVQLLELNDPHSIVLLKERIVALSITQHHIGERLLPCLDTLITRLTSAMPASTSSTLLSTSESHLVSTPTPPHAAGGEDSPSANRKQQADSLAAMASVILPYSVFVQHCKKTTISSSMAGNAASLLAGLGTVLYCQKAQVVVVDPHWLVELFSRLQASCRATYGKLSMRNLEAVWPPELCPPALITTVMNFFADYKLCLTPAVELLNIDSPTADIDILPGPCLSPVELHLKRFSLVPSLFLEEIATEASNSLHSLVTQPLADSLTLCRIWALRYLPGDTFFAYLMLQILLSGYTVPTFWKTGFVVRDSIEASDIAIVVLDLNRSRITLMTRSRRGSRLFRVIDDHMSRGFDCMHRERPRDPYPVANVWVQCPHCLDNPTLFIAPTHFSYSELMHRCLAGETHVLCSNPMTAPSPSAAPVSVPVDFSTCIPDITLEDLRHRNLHIDRKDLHFARLLGRGGFGTVELGYYADDKDARQRPLAIKTLSTDNDDNESALVKVAAFRREIDAQAQLDHPAVVKLVGFSTVSPLTMVQECAMGGDLYHLSAEWKAAGRQPSPQHTLQIAYEIACAVEYLHVNLQPAMIHRDIKAPNVLLLTTDIFGDPLLHSPIAKLADFGLATSFPVVGDTNAVENPAWLAPECIEFGNYSKASDIFGLGVFLWENLFLRPPYHDVQYRFPSELGQLICKGVRPTVPERVPSRRYVALMKKMWNTDPAKRPSATKVRSVLHRLLTKYRSSHFPDLVFVDAMTAIDDEQGGDGTLSHNTSDEKSESERSDDLLLDELLDDFGAAWEAQGIPSLESNSQRSFSSASSRSSTANFANETLRAYYLMKNQHQVGLPRGPAFLTADLSLQSRSRSQSHSRSKSKPRVAKSKNLSLSKSKDTDAFKQMSFFDSFLATQHGVTQQATWTPVAGPMAAKKKQFITKLLDSTAEKNGISDPQQRKDFELFFNVVGTQKALDEMVGMHWLALEANDVDFEDEAEEIKIARTDFEAFYASTLAKPAAAAASSSTASSSSPPPTASTSSSTPAPPELKKKKSLFSLSSKKSKDPKTKPPSKRKQAREEASLAMTDLEAFLAQ